MYRPNACPKKLKISNNTAPNIPFTINFIKTLNGHENILNRSTNAISPITP
ncbi:hypothetical protein D3C73_1047310 [compost metagenome]